MDLELTGRTAVVTGASKGIGLAITAALAAEGVTVVAGALRGSPELDALAEGGRVHAVTVDLTTATGPAALIDAAIRRLGGIDILVKTGDGRTVVYQLKYFPEGFDGKAWGKRREKVTSSLKTAGKTYPDLDEWVLVYPARPTPSGTVFISKLKPENVNTKVTVWHR